MSGWDRFAYSDLAFDWQGSVLRVRLENFDTGKFEVGKILPEKTGENNLIHMSSLGAGGCGS